jgi:peptidyl-prolyl cis-trans isomerase B (cyclophilin B)
MRLKLILIALSFLLVNFINTSYAESDEVVILHTKSGNIVIEFFPEDAPNHVENFLNLTKNGFYDKTIFHRIIKDFMIQGGDPLTKSRTNETISQWGMGEPGYSIKAEFNNIKHNRGIVSMARSSNPDSAGSQFFIVHKDSNFLDGQYTVFGRLATQESFETLDKIANLETSSNDIPVNWDEAEILRGEVVNRAKIPELLNLGEPERVTKTPVKTLDEKYSSDKFGFSITFPTGWQVQEPQKTNPNTPDVAAIGPKTSGFHPTISITIRESNGTSLEKLVEDTKISLKPAIDSGQMTILSEGMTKVDGKNAYQFISTGNFITNSGNLNVKFKEVIIEANNQFFGITYANSEQNFDDDLKHYDDALNTFKITSENSKSSNGGCLIATATYGSELAPQVQHLRETRDNILLKTESGKLFLTSFNQIYYSFSPTLSDWERQNPIFKETIRIVITPLLTSLSILNYLDIDSEAEIVGYGISLIALNIGIYFVAPAYVFHKFRK